MFRLKQATIGFILCVGIALSHAPASVAQQSDRPALPTAQKAPLTLDEIVSSMEQRNQERDAALRGFEGTREYRVQYRGLFGNREAAMTVGVRYVSPDDKEFTILSQSGSKLLIDHVLKGLLQAEKEAASGESHQRSTLTAQNYDFSFAEAPATGDEAEYVLNVAPKTPDKFLYRGKIWVDAKDFAVTRIEAEPAKNPSFWIKKSEIRHRYEKVEDFWLPAENQTESSIRLGGRALLSIEYKDYKIMYGSTASERDGGAASGIQDAALR